MLGGAPVSHGGRLGLVGFESSRRRRGACSAAAAAAASEAEMHKGKGKLSGVLHKGFKPDKWSVGIDFWCSRGGGGCPISRPVCLFVCFPSKTSLRMAVARIKLLRNRKEVQVRQMRREVAQLLESNQDMTARIRVRALPRRLAPSKMVLLIRRLAPPIGWGWGC